MRGSARPRRLERAGARAGAGARRRPSARPELTEPGYLHDVFSAWHPLWVGGARARRARRRAGGARARVPEHRPADRDALPGRRGRVPRSARPRTNEAELGPEWRGVRRVVPARMRTSPSACSAPSSGPAMGVGLAATRVPPARRPWRCVEFTGTVLATSRDWLTETFASGAGARAAGAVGAAHRSRAGRGRLGLHDAGDRGRRSRRAGCPIPRGGGARLVEALVRLIEDHGGACRDGAGRRARRSSRTAARRRAASQTARSFAPSSAVHRQRDADPAVRAARSTGHDGLAVGALPLRPRRRCRSTSRSPSRRAGNGDERLGRTAIVHLTPGLDGVSRAVNEAERGLLPAEATVVVGQPLTIDPSPGARGRRAALDPAAGAAAGT